MDISLPALPLREAAFEGPLPAGAVRALPAPFASLSPHSAAAQSYHVQLALLRRCNLLLRVGSRGCSGSLLTLSSGAGSKSAGTSPFSSALGGATALPKGAKPAPFLVKLGQMLDTPRFAAMISWTPDGDRIHLRDLPQFCAQVCVTFHALALLARAAAGTALAPLAPPRAQVLPQFFKHGKFPSFLRQLNHYGFKTVSQKRRGVERVFEHPRFTQGNRDLALIKRRTPGSSTAAAAAMAARVVAAAAPALTFDASGLVGSGVGSETPITPTSRTSDSLPAPGTGEESSWEDVASAVRRWLRTPILCVHTHGTLLGTPPIGAGASAWGDLAQAVSTLAGAADAAVHARWWGALAAAVRDAGGGDTPPAPPSRCHSVPLSAMDLHSVAAVSGPPPPLVLGSGTRNAPAHLRQPSPSRKRPRRSASTKGRGGGTTPLSPDSSMPPPPRRRSRRVPAKLQSSRISAGSSAGTRDRPVAAPSPRAAVEAGRAPTTDTASLTPRQNAALQHLMARQQVLDARLAVAEAGQANLVAQGSTLESLLAQVTMQHAAFQKLLHSNAGDPHLILPGPGDVAVKRPRVEGSSSASAGHSRRQRPLPLDVNSLDTRSVDSGMSGGDTPHSTPRGGGYPIPSSLGQGSSPAHSDPASHSRWMLASALDYPTITDWPLASRHRTASGARSQASGAGVGAAGRGLDQPPVPTTAATAPAPLLAPGLYTMTQAGLSPAMGTPGVVGAGSHHRGGGAWRVGGGAASSVGFSDFGPGSVSMRGDSPKSITSASAVGAPPIAFMGSSSGHGGSSVSLTRLLTTSSVPQDGPAASSGGGPITTPRLGLSLASSFRGDSSMGSSVWEGEPGGGGGYTRAEAAAAVAAEMASRSNTPSSAVPRTHPSGPAGLTSITTPLLQVASEMDSSVGEGVEGAASSVSAAEVQAAAALLQAAGGGGPLGSRRRPAPERVHVAYDDDGQ